MSFGGNVSIVVSLTTSALGPHSPVGPAWVTTVVFSFPFCQSPAGKTHFSVH